MLFRGITCALVGGLALDVAAAPTSVLQDGSGDAKQAHAVLSRNPLIRPAFVPANKPVDSEALSIRDVPVPDLAAHPATRRTIPETHALHERQMPRWAQTWRRAERVPRDALLPMRIGLKQCNLNEGHERLMAISDPKSSSYGKHMSAKEVIALFAPHRTTVEAVVSWLTSSGIVIDRITQSANKQWIQFDATAAEAEDLLMADYYVFEHASTGTRDVAADHYHLPHNIREHVDYVTPGIRLRHDAGKEKQMKRRQLRQAQNRKNTRRTMRPMHTTPQPIDVSSTRLNSALPLNNNTCDKYVTPACIRAQYNIPKGTKAAKGNKLGIFESLNQHYNRDDLDSYFKQVAPEIPKGTYPEDRLVDGAVGAVAVNDAGSEAELDFQAAMPLIYPQGTVLYQVDDERIQANQTSGDTPYLGFWNTFFDAIDGSYCNFTAFGESGNCVKPECLDPSYPDLEPGGYKGSLQCGVYEPTNVISISYGGGEADLPDYYSKRQCTEIMKLGLQGVTVVMSSGDNGVASFPFDGGNADGCAGDKGQVFYPSSQATCPYVLAVGSTEFYVDASQATTGNRSSTVRLAERATTRFGSGGGFSNYFPQPSYQWSAVADYFSRTTLPFKGYINNNKNFSSVGDGVYHIGGRGYPDVAALGDHFVTMLNGNWAQIGGTSLSAPIWASVLTLVNEERLAQDKKPLGFVNPALYQNPDVFTDITEGSNPGCGINGFPTARGWDPVTGLGSPNYPKLVTRLSDLP